MKTIKLILISLIGLLTVSCDDDETMTIIEHRCLAIYQLVNKTDSNILVNRIYGIIENSGEFEYISEETIISSSETKEIDRFFEPCTQEVMIEDLNNEVLLIVSRNISVEVYADERQLNEALMDKINWEITITNDGQVIFLLVVTDELIESVGYAPE